MHAGKSFNMHHVVQSAMQHAPQSHTDMHRSEVINHSVTYTCILTTQQFNTAQHHNIKQHRKWTMTTGRKNTFLDTGIQTSHKTATRPTFHTDRCLTLPSTSERVHYLINTKQKLRKSGTGHNTQPNLHKVE